MITRASVARATGLSALQIGSCVVPSRSPPPKVESCPPNVCRFSRSEAPASLRAERHAALPDLSTSLQAA
jgi:hypothetical protein